MSDDEQTREEVYRRFPVWGWQSAPARKYVLLVAGYFRTRGPFFVEGEDKYLRLLNNDGRALLELVETSADRPLTATELADAIRWADAAAEDVLRRVGRSTIPRFGPEPFEYLRLALGDPQQAAAQLIRYPAAVPDNEQWYPPLFDPTLSYPSVLRVMECFWPVAWEPSLDWTPPPDAVRWARRIYEHRDFTDLPILADLLEDAGCPNRPLLDHSRCDQEQFRGCAALDRLLGL